MPVSHPDIRFDAPFLDVAIVAERDKHFPRFVADLLEGGSYPDLQIFDPNGGKDGAIDATWRAEGGLGVIECKCAGKDWAHISAAWTKTRKHLLDNLQPDRPKALQYQPWYDTARPVTDYRLCTTWWGRKQEEVDKLVADIRALFDELGDRSGLSHLKAIRIRVMHWGILARRLDRRVATLLRWFPTERPGPFSPLDTAAASRSKRVFADYLDGAALPFFSMATFAAQNGEPAVANADPDALLTMLEAGDDTGLMIFGPGGVGKTRLMLEVGRLAAERNWAVLDTRGTIAATDLDRLLDRAEGSPSDRVLLLIDYAEEQPDIGAIAERLAWQSRRSVRFVATCRANAFRRHLYDLPGCRQIDLTGEDFGDRDQKWRCQYRLWVVQRILDHAGIPAEETVLSECADIPVLAVFLAYVKAQRPADDMRALLATDGLTTWLRRRLRRHLGAVDIDRPLAALMALMPADYAPLAADAPYDAVLRWLVEDGWIAPRGDGRHHTIHDVVADRMVLEYVRPARAAGAQAFLGHLLAEAERLDLLGSALRSLERVAELPPFDRVDWPAAIAARVIASPDRWGPWVATLLSGALQSRTDTLRLVRRFAALQDGLVATHAGRHALGFAARTLAADAPADLRTWIVDMLKRALEAWPDDDYVLVSGLMLDPPAFAPAAESWLDRHPTAMEAHFILVAWLEGGLPLESIRSRALVWADACGGLRKFSFLATALVKAGDALVGFERFFKGWLRRYGEDLEASYVLKAWLDAGGGVEAVSANVRAWLDDHPTAQEASYVLKVWLDSGGGVDVVSADVRAWLDAHPAAPESRFVLQAWLDAKGDVEAVSADVRAWLDAYPAAPEARFLLQAWLDAKGDVEAVSADVRAWLDAYPAAQEASYVLKVWLDAGGGVDMVSADVRAWVDAHPAAPEAQFVLNAWLRAGGDVGAVSTDVRVWLDTQPTVPAASHVLQAWLDAGGGVEAVSADVRAWLEGNPDAPDADFLLKAWLDAKGHPGMVEGAVRHWLARQGDTLAASYLFRSWLAAGGDYAVVGDAAGHWLDRHCRDHDAEFVLRPVLKQPVLPPGHVAAALIWCHTFAADPETPNRLRLLLLHLIDRGWQPALIAPLLRCWRVQSAAVPSLSVRAAWLWLLGQLTYRPFSGRSRAAIETLLLAWLRHPDFCSPALPTLDVPPARHHLANMVFRMVVLVRSGRLAPGRDAVPLRKFLALWNALPPGAERDDEDRLIREQAEMAAAWLAKQLPPPAQ
ncbi:MAG: hypothetical protein HQL42_08635 [Alphaproteobacteria bacterium]|nr:hypothetical protein [Alphaproteobacteria bacterium]